jgi:hypothetical protein
MLKLLGIVLLVVLVLVGALMPLRYTARIKRPDPATLRDPPGSDRSGTATDE